MDKTICELFAGVGGFRLGFQKASTDWKTVWFSQWEPGKKKQWAHDCYVKHFGDIDEFTGIDIAEVDKKNIPDHNLLVGGFPCQDYSVARPLPGSTGIRGKKGVLWWQIRDTLEAKRPPFVLLENVDRLLKSPASQRGRDFGVMLACLADLGYLTEWRVINAADYGAAQRRRRVFIFASHISTNHSKQLLGIDKEKVLVEGGFFARVFRISSNKKTSSIDIDYQDIPKISEGFSYDFGNAGLAIKGNIMTTSVEPEFEEPKLIWDIRQKDVSSKYYLGDNIQKWKYLKGSKKLKRTSKTGHDYTFSEGSISFPDRLDMPARTMLTSESSINRSTHVIRDPQTDGLRLLTPVEAERIQGFEDNWTDTGMPEKFRYFCMGNALVVSMVTRMGKELNRIFEAE